MIMGMRSPGGDGRIGESIELIISIYFMNHLSFRSLSLAFCCAALPVCAQDGGGNLVNDTNLAGGEEHSGAANNVLTEAEKADGWELLWDGKTSAGWRSAKTDDFPQRGWSMRDGVLIVHENGGQESAAGGDIITRKRYNNFELTADFKITPGANSGIKIFAQPGISPIDKVTGKPTAVGSAIGLEFQILDDARHPDAKLGRNGDRTIGSLYDLIPAPKDKVVMAVGEWNHARILSQGRHVVFWMNGRQTVEFDRGSDDFRARVAASKFKNVPDFGEWADGHILLQDHGNQAFFKNLKIRVLPGN